MVILIGKVGEKNSKHKSARGCYSFRMTLDQGMLVLNQWAETSTRF
jgi:hypothetical protein